MGLLYQRVYRRIVAFADIAAIVGDVLYSEQMTESLEVETNLYGLTVAERILKQFVCQFLLIVVLNCL